MLAKSQFQQVNGVLAPQGVVPAGTRSELSVPAGSSPSSGHLALDDPSTPIENGTGGLVGHPRYGESMSG